MRRNLSLRAAYDKVATTCGAARNEPHARFRSDVRDAFVRRVGAVGVDVLDLGAGPGLDALEFARAGLRPLAIDISPAMVARCRELGIAGEAMDFERLKLMDRKFAGVWSAFALLHVRKQLLDRLLPQVSRLLQPGGEVGILLFEGAGEGSRMDDTLKFGTARHFAYHTAPELRAAVGRHFEISQEARHDNSLRPALAICGRKPATSKRRHQDA